MYKRQLFILTVVVAFIIWAMFTLSISVNGVSFAGFEITQKAVSYTHLDVYKRQPYDITFGSNEKVW